MARKTRQANSTIPGQNQIVLPFPLLSIAPKILVVFSHQIDHVNPCPAAKSQGTLPQIMRPLGTTILSGSSAQARLPLVVPPFATVDTPALVGKHVQVQSVAPSVSPTYCTVQPVLSLVSTQTSSPLPSLPTIVDANGNSPQVDMPPILHISIPLWILWSKNH
ncbi:Hypothetical predicted protein [Olea europaea subsp. europaea]|uniref:Uncharacterized protein n=1 Tax=Olea europaea subsp. europaea TaxID=158383 RepID=A0A8S0S8E2_OLEEU|nr:Hypothetical predicted protein [Olea europaea subsp. europaea]